MNEKQQQLTFDKGITNVPSDALCSDNALEECVGLVYENGEHRVIQKPVEGATVDGKLLFVHKIPGGTFVNYIFLKSANIKWHDTSIGWSGTICAASGDAKVAAIGKTLIINTGGHVYYAVWKGTSYLFLRDRLPEVELRFSMTRASSKLDPRGNTDWTDFNYEVKTVGISSDDEDFAVINSHEGEFSTFNHYWFHEVRHQDKFNEAMIGIVSAHLANVKKLKRFCFPFWVRYAVRMYDGSYTCISNPILMMPTVHYNRNAFFSTGDMQYRHPDDDDEVWPATYDPYAAKLQYQVVTAISNDWSDIVKGVDIFVSEEVRSFNLESDWRILNPNVVQERNETVLEQNIGPQGFNDNVNALAWNPEYSGYSPSNPTTEDKKKFTSYILPVQWTEEEFKKRLLEATVFYKLFELELDEVSSSGSVTDATTKIDTMTLPNLTTQTQLEKDDYMSHTELQANIIKAYNSRLHMADLTKGFFNGFGHFSNMVQTDPTTRNLVVYIRTDDGERVVKKTVTSYEVFEHWFYYPDPRAYRAEVYTDSQYVAFKLDEHPALNGAYAFFGLPFTVSPARHNGSVPNVNNTPERIVNRVIVSEVDNPWVFDTSGDVTVGSSRIKGLATQTMALGQEEHGLHPLTVFTEDGVYGLHLNKEGAYMQADLYSREVCSNPNSITETDGAVFFASKKGLMVTAGNQVKCVSEQLSGRNNATYISSVGFVDFLQEAFIAYDYRDSLLWIFNPITGFENHCYIYAIKSGTFSKFYSDDAIENVVNAYPDFLLQHLNNNKKLYSLIERPDINNDTRAYSATMITRPMKLENALALKTIMQIRHVADMTPSARMRFTIEASNNLKNWVELRSLRGTPWKYYRFRYDFSEMNATDRFAGTVLITQERRTNKLR